MPAALITSNTHLLQAKMLNMGHEMTDAKKDLAVLEKENETRLTQLHEATSGDTLRFVSLEFMCLW